MYMVHLFQPAHQLQKQVSPRLVFTTRVSIIQMNNFGDEKLSGIPFAWTIEPMKVRVRFSPMGVKCSSIV